MTLDGSYINILPYSNMKKEFDSWNKKKKSIQKKEVSRFHKKREVWWCSIGINVGSEIDGRSDLFQRPVLIYKSLSRNTALIIPLTTANYVHKYRTSIGTVGDKQATAIISQIKVIDTKRLTERIDIISNDTYENIRKAVRNLF